MFEFREKYKLRSSFIKKDFERIKLKDDYYEKSTTVITKYGIIVVWEYSQMLNNGRQTCSLFTTFMNGFVFNAFIKEAGIREHRLKHLACSFIKEIIKKEQL